MVKKFFLATCNRKTISVICVLSIAFNFAIILSNREYRESLEKLLGGATPSEKTPPVPAHIVQAALSQEDIERVLTTFRDDDFFQNLLLLQAAKNKTSNKASIYNAISAPSSYTYSSTLHAQPVKIDKDTIESYEKFYNTKLDQHVETHFKSEKFKKTISLQAKFLAQSIQILNELIESDVVQIDTSSRTFIELSNFISSLASDDLLKFPPEITNNNHSILVTISKINDKPYRSKLLTPTLDLFINANNATTKLIAYSTTSPASGLPHQ